jgi:RNA polymerase sigma factor (sigma-70 family)
VVSRIPTTNRAEVPTHRVRSDSELVAAAKDGSRPAFDELLQRYSRTAFVVALAHVPDADTAEDVAQDALIQAWSALDQCRNPQHFGAWLSTIVRRTASNLNTKTARRSRMSERFQSEIASHNNSGPPPADSRLLDGEIRRALELALGSLAPRQREVILLCDLEGRSHSEVAALLGITPATSRKHLSDARHRVRSELSMKELTP